MRLSDNWLAIIFIAVAAAMLGFTLTFPAFPGQKYGPSLFPRILATGIILCALLIIYRARQRRNEGQGEPLLAIDPAFRERYRLWSFLAVPGAVVVYLLLADRLGFLPTSFMLLLGLMLWFGVQWLRAVVIALAMTGLMHWFFASVMRVPLPRGLFMQLLVGG
jgi:putative tricarboxylic transport membrane protein